MKTIFRYCKPVDLVFYAFIAPLFILGSVMFAMSLQPVIDTGLSGDMAAFTRAIIMVLIWTFVDVFVGYWEEYGRNRIKTEYTRQLRLSYFDRYFHQRIDRFTSADSSSYLSKLTVDCEVIAEKYCESILNTYRSIWSLIISLAAIISARWELALYVVVFSLISVNLPKLFQKQADKAEQDYLENNNEHIRLAQEGIQNYVLIRLYHLLSRKKDAYADATLALEKSDRTRRSKALTVDMVAAGISELSFVLIIVVCMLLVIRGNLSVGYVMSISQLLGGIMFPFEMLPGYLLSYRTDREVYLRNEKELNEAIMQDGTQVLSASAEGHTINMQDVDFSYNDDRPILSSLNLTMHTNKKYALVGESGSGKSTVAKLIMGFLLPDQGRVTIDGTPVAQYEEGSLFSAVAYQSQSITFFQDTLLENILLGSESSPERLKQVLHDAKLYGLIEALPEYENTLITENGKNISGGEAQRIGLARSLVRTPSFMIFDEITASLDNQNASEIERSILSLSGCGILAITHRLHEESMRLYDTIFVLKDGAIVEQGSWDALIQAKGELYQLATREQTAK